MKLKFIGILTFMSLFFTSKSSNETEEHYVILKKVDNIEIREYKNLIYASYIPLSEADRNNSFRNIAGYIFGNNNKNEEIAMTSPVVVKLHKSNEMNFIMPKKYNLNNLPKPNNKEVKIYEENSSIKACIRYSGYSNSKIEKLKITELKKKLKKHNINHTNDFEVLIYNSPWKIINRRNEISVSVEYNSKKMEKAKKNNIEKVYLGGGCFWCIEAVFEDVIGVTNVQNGYSGGKIKNPSYKEVSNGLTKHAEVCKISFDTQKIKLEDLLNIFFLTHDPTTMNRQGNDIGAHYRSIIFYQSEKEKNIITNFTKQINKELFNNKIVTEIKKFNKFYIAEGYHQNYYKENSSENYCRFIINPKLTKAKNNLSKYYSQSSF